MAYNSDIDLKLGETPKTTDPAIFPDMLEIYSAIHILGQWVNAVKDIGNSGGPEKAPWDAMPFRDWFYAEAARDITRGSVVTAVGSSRFRAKAPGTQARPEGPYFTVEGIVNGAAGEGIPYESTIQFGGTFPLGGGVTGFAMKDAAAGELVQVGIGPAIVNVEGIKFGQSVFALAAYRNPIQPFQGYWVELINDGGLVTLQEGGGHYAFPSELICVGKGVAPDAMMFCPPTNWAKAYSNTANRVNPPPPAPDYGGGDA